FLLFAIFFFAGVATNSYRVPYKLVFFSLTLIWNFGISRCQQGRGIQPIRDAIALVGHAHRRLKPPTVEDSIVASSGGGGFSCLSVYRPVEHHLSARRAYCAAINRLSGSLVPSYGTQPPRRIPRPIVRHTDTIATAIFPFARDARLNYFILRRLSLPPNE
ncbi:unnamed protein product, partial [Nesidiocoris tenuis]